MITYIFNYFSGYGIGEISSHTIDFYPIKVKADSDKEAINKCLKMASKLRKFNKCYDLSRIPVIIDNKNNKKVGIFYKKDNIIKWEGEIIYHSPQCFGGNYNLQDFTIKSCDYPTIDTRWTKNYFCSVTYPSYKSYMLYVWDRMNGNRTFSSMKDTRTEDLNRYFFKQIDIFLESDKVPNVAKQDLIVLKQEYLPKL